MRKYIFLLLFLLALCSEMLAQSASNSINDKSYSRTIQLGQSETFNPYINSGVPASMYIGCGYNTNLLNANDIDVLAASITSINGWGNLTCEYINYRLIPKKSGNYTFQTWVEYVPTGATKSNTKKVYLTLNLNVVEVTKIQLSETSKSLYIGESFTITSTILQNGATTTLTWKSSNNSVVSVNSEGEVTALGVGSATITCTAHNGVSAQCEVTVNPVLMSSITLNETNAEMIVGENLQLQATIAPENTTDKSVTWSSTNEAVAVVDESGQVTAVGSGTCQVKATANDGSGKTASCLVTVEKNNKLTVTDMTQCSGGQGVMNVLLSDEETVMGFQFDLLLPTGVTVAEKDGKLLAALTGNAVNTHSIASSKISDGLYRFIVTPQGSRAISNDTGDGMTITIDVADDVAVGAYTMAIKDIEMTVKKTGNVYEDIHPRNSTATLTVTEAVMGDVNGDGRVSVTDVISMNSYILEEEPARFIRKVADLNSDGKVTITDMVQVIDIILGR